MRKFAPLIVLIGLLTAGCWQTVNRPYRDVMSLQPFAAGAVTTTDARGKPIHYALKKIARGRYRMTQTDRGSDFGQGFEMGFFPLPGAPSNVLVYQAAPLDHTAAGANLRYYGVLVVTGRKSAEEVRPDCEKDARAPRAHAWAGTAPAPSGIATRWRNRCWRCGRAARSRNTAIR